MTDQDPPFHERPDPDRPGGFDSGSHGGGGGAPPPHHGAPMPMGEARNGLGTASLACGIVGLVLSLIPAVNLFTWPLGVLAIVFGAVGWSRVNKGQATNKSQTIAGLVLGIVSFFTFCLIYVLLSAGSGEYYNLVPTF